MRRSILSPSHPKLTRQPLLIKHIFFYRGVTGPPASRSSLHGNRIYEMIMRNSLIYFKCPWDGGQVLFDLQEWMSGVVHPGSRPTLDQPRDLVPSPSLTRQFFTAIFFFVFCINLRGEDRSTFVTLVFRRYLPRCCKMMLGECYYNHHLTALWTQICRQPRRPRWSWCRRPPPKYDTGPSALFRPTYHSHKEPYGRLPPYGFGEFLLIFTPTAALERLIQAPIDIIHEQKSRMIRERNVVPCFCASTAAEFNRVWGVSCWRTPPSSASCGRRGRAGASVFLQAPQGLLINL